MNNILKKILNLGPWPYAIIGSLLILLSTYILGVKTFRDEQNLLKIQNKFSTIESKIHESQRHFDTANMQVRLAAIQNSVLKYNLLKNSNLEEKRRKNYVQSLFAELCRLGVAAGDVFLDQKQIENLNQLITKSIEGDDSALQEINNIMLELYRKSEKYREELKIEKDVLEKSEDKIKQSIIRWKNWATIMQIIGLFLLLTKEFPDYLWGTKKK